MAKQRITTTAKRMQALINRVAASAASPIAGGLAEHIEKTAAEGHDGVGLHDHQSTEQGGLLDHGWLSGLGDDDHPQYAGIAQTEDITGVWTHRNTLNVQHVLPRTPDTWDLGSELLRFRTGHISELRATIFAEETLSLVGGWLSVPHGQGALESKLLDNVNYADLGQEGLSPGDIIELRDVGQVEYLRIESHIDAGVYFVTRDLDGSGANEWVAGTVYRVLGQAGDGRIDLNAHDTPRISIIEQGASYNQQTEHVRLGDLENWQGAGLTGYGLAAGSFEDDEYLYYTPSTGLVVEGTVKARAGYLKDLSIDGVLSIGLSGGIYQGTGTFVAPSRGLKIWNESGVGRIAGFDGGNEQWYAGADGKFYAGQGRVTLDRNGVAIAVGTSIYNKIRWVQSGSDIGYINVEPTSSVDRMVFSVGDAFAYLGGTYSYDGIRSRALVADTGVYFDKLYQGQVGVGHMPVYTFVPYIYTIEYAVAKNAGAHVYTVTDYGVPSAAKAVHLLLGGRWGSTNGSALVRGTHQSNNQFALSISNTTTNQFCGNPVMLSSDNKFALIISGDNMTICYLRIVGYYI